MKLPNADRVSVPVEKIVDYLLSETHVVGRHKAAFFRGHGYHPDRWRELAESLEAHATQHEISKEEPSPFGKRFVVEGIMELADQRTALVRTVWFLRFEESVPRFVTAYPLPHRDRRDPK